MILKKLRLRNFRNYDLAVFEFNEGINCIIGKNAQGKTNLLESIYYLSTTRSHRSNDEKDLIKNGCDFFGLDAVLLKKGRNVELTCNTAHNGKNLFLYRNPVKKVSDFIGECNAVLFCPDDMNLFSAQPRIRRRFMDIELGKISKSYMQTLNQYQKLLKERNALLKQNKFSLELMAVLNDQMASLQCIILHQRYQFMKDLLLISKDFYQKLAEDDTDLSLDYQTCVDLECDEKTMKQAFLKRYEETFERDCLLKTTGIGIHKDDFTIMVNGKDAAVYASQGQKRTILLSLKIGIIKMIQQIIKDEPILLLDDVFSELDLFRKQKLMELLPENVQIFISATEIEKTNFNRNVTLFTIESGKIQNVARRI